MEAQACKGEEPTMIKMTPSPFLGSAILNKYTLIHGKTARRL